jgi:hypothetical protein
MTATTESRLRLATDHTPSGRSRDRPAPLTPTEATMFNAPAFRARRLAAGLTQVQAAAHPTTKETDR